MQNNKNKLLILNCNQFGYLTDVYKICEHLNNEWDITVVCWDYNKPKLLIDGIKVNYISRDGNIVQRNYRLLSSYYKNTKLNYDVVFAVYQKGISLIKLFSGKKNINLDVRTLSISKSKFNRTINDKLLKFESLFFKNKSIVSHSLAKKIGFFDYNLLPLGSDAICTKQKITDKLNFVYVGTFTGRNLINCVIGFHKFLTKNNITEGVSFDLIGDGYNSEVDEIKNYVFNNENLINIVKLHGRLPHNKIKAFFNKSLVGVSYVPITEYYNFQPPTKTFEYLLSNLCVLATKTHEHLNFINDKNVLLINDDIESIASGFEEIYSKYIKGKLIFQQNDYTKFKWKSIIEQDFKNLLSKMVKE